ncbi:two-component response regulator ORR41-like [Punica granatum]|uniref:Two-component response regulator ORR41-like n=1 Tax=Punica granatum TaxID=22663 RepID=A0A6P8CGY1_PUNGR|nr:two-component response regulator ORR41-like [Punica granatum]
MTSEEGASSNSPKRAKTEFGDVRKIGRFTVETQRLVKVLIVEADDTLRVLDKMTIESLNLPVTVQEAANGSKAVDMYRATPFDVIFMGLEMPVMNGIEATKVLRDIGARSMIIGMVLITLNNDELVQAFQEAGLDECRRMPMTSNEFRSILQKARDKI